MSGFLRLFHTLSDADIRYVVVGGVAVVLHGHVRATADVTWCRISRRRAWPAP
jgi:hypothetical protein